MLIAMPEDLESRKKTVDYLKEQGLTVKEVYPQ